MAVLHAVAGFLLALFGYSVAAALAGRGRPVVPSTVDLVAAPAAAVGILVAGAGTLGWWLLPGAAAGGALIGWLPAPFRGDPTGGAATVERPFLEREPEDREDGVRAGARALMMRTGSFQGRLFLGLFYFVVLAPFALLARSIQDPLRRTSEGPEWITRSPADDEASETSLRRPY